MDLKSLTAEICTIAIEGGKYLAEERKNFKLDKVEEKNAHDYVSYVDKETEKLLVAKLSALLPQAGFITEENTAEEYKDQDYVWIIDPLDGTTNYIHDYAPYCVSIALRYKGELQIGVVYEVCRDECFFAWKDGGAYINGQKIHVSDIAEMNKAFVGFDLPYEDKLYKPVANTILNELYGKSASLRMCGSAAMALCFVAAGRFDIWAEAFINPWDYSAGALIIIEAGGEVTNFRGEDKFSDSHHIIASNGLLHEDMIPLLEPFVDSLLK